MISESCVDLALPGCCARRWRHASALCIVGRTVGQAKSAPTYVCLCAIFWQPDAKTSCPCNRPLNLRARAWRNVCSTIVVLRAHGFPFCPSPCAKMRRQCFFPLTKLQRERQKMNGLLLFCCCVECVCVGGGSGEQWKTNAARRKTCISGGSVGVSACEAERPGMDATFNVPFAGC